jgi:phage gp29-like protein
MAEREEKKKQPIKDEVATASKDLDIFSGWLNRLENPDPTLRTESQGKGLKLYDEVDRDPHAGAVLQTRSLSVISKEWDVLPGEEPSSKGRPATVTRAQKIADFVKQTLLNNNFDQFRQELLQAVLYGFYVGEVMWEVRDGAIVPGRVRAKHPRRFSFTMDRELRLLTSQNMIDGEPVPDRKFIRFTYGSSDNPYGKGLGQKLWWPVWFKKNGIKFWLVFLEKYGMPTAIGKYEPGTEPEQQQALLDAIDAIQNETAVKIPNTMAIELLEATRAGKVTYESLCEYMDKQISKAVLGQTASTEGTPGKLGKEEAQEETRQDILVADAGLLDECLNGSIVRWIVDFNFTGVTAYPKIQTRTEAEKDLKPLAERDKVLAHDIGVPIGKRYFYETYAIPEPEENEELVTPATGKPFDQGGGGAEFAEGGFSQEGIDQLSQQAAKDANEAISALLGPVLGMVEGAKSFEEIGEKIYGLYPDLDSDQFQELLARAMFAAGLTGFAASEGEEGES